MPAPTFYAQQMLNLHNKYGLSNNAKTLLRALDDYKFGRIDQKELGRIVRLSNNMRKAITDTIKKCAQIMGTKPAEVKHCVEIIQSCTEILAVADQPPPIEEFPLMQLPPEVRENIYDKYLAQKGGRIAVAHPKKSTCVCAGHEPPAHLMFPTLNTALAQTCRQINHEFLTYFYGRFVFHFSCPCDMLENLRANNTLQQQIRSVKVHWTGSVADKAFVALSKCPMLNELHIVISKATTRVLTKREIRMQRFFTPHKPARISDVLGMDELLRIRGLEEVSVSHILLKQGSRRSDEDRANLQALLRSKLKLPKDGYKDGDTDGDDE